MEVKGSAVIAIRDYVKAQHQARYKEWLEALSQDSRSIFEGVIDSTGWYPVKYAAVEPTVKLSNFFFEKDHKLGAKESGRYSAQKALNGIYKIFVKASSPSYLIARAARVFATYYRPCQMRAVKKEEKGVVLEITGMENSHTVIEHRIAGWVEKGLEISGAKNVQINIETQETDGQVKKSLVIKWE